MANKRKLNSASTQANKLITELHERREKIKTQVQFRNEILESQKETLTTKMNSTGYKVLND